MDGNCDRARRGGVRSLIEQRRLSSRRVAGTENAQVRARNRLPRRPAPPPATAAHPGRLPRAPRLSRQPQTAATPPCPASTRLDASASVIDEGFRGGKEVHEEPFSFLERSIKTRPVPDVEHRERDVGIPEAVQESPVAPPVPLEDPIDTLEGGHSVRSISKKGPLEPPDYPASS